MLNHHTQRSVLNKILVVFMLVLLPLQFSQAAVCAYCEYEMENAPQHSMVADSVHTGSHGEQGNGAHNGCGVCHLCFAKLRTEQPSLNSPLSLSTTFVSEYFPPHYSFISDNIERPNWPLAI